MIWINIKLALNSIRRAKLRSFLTMVAVIIGVAAFTIITTTVEGLKASVANEINTLGGNLVTINPGKILERDEEGNVENINFAASFGTSTLTERDLKAVQKVEGVKAAAPQMIVSGAVTRNNAVELTGGLIVATNQDYPIALAQNVENGEFWTDEKSDNGFVVIGSSVVEELYGGDLVLGTKIQIRGEDFTVIGSMEEFSFSVGFGPDINKAVLIPLDAGKEFNGGVTQIQEIDLQIEDTANVDDVVAEIEALLLKNHGGEEDFTVLKQDELISVTNGIFDILKSASQAISYIMLFVGGIVILLIMLITVTERTREIGIRKSIGATNGNIMIQFLTEAVVLTWVGSLIGLLVAFLVGLIVKASIDITPAYSIGSLFAVVFISTFIGALAGFYPAYQAAKKDPVEALRHE